VIHVGPQTYVYGGCQPPFRQGSCDTFAFHDPRRNRSRDSKALLGLLDQGVLCERVVMRCRYMLLCVERERRCASGLIYTVVIIGVCEDEILKGSS
jgi:hypothetical protein